MANDDDLRHFPKVPPESEEDWQRLHRAMFRADRSWIVTGPQVAFVTNWKAWIFGLSMLALMRRSEVVAVIDMLTGGAK
jgi:hypothetical protein